ncbi:MAG: flagellar biosynthesis protein FlhB [Deltaproteobacteria bacterium HGW-Deltaproteobacteria-24]|nr:MAG: flagellar biosynthesis protein FlhB [Deltaproteobacteria bacterium HGW-Deltaproteobacteria-24]
MADDEDKTEEPTSKRIDDAKNDGNVPKSMEVVGATALFFGTVYLLFLFSFSSIEIKKMMLFSYSFIGSEMDGPLFYTITRTIVTTMMYALLPIFVLIMILIFVSNWAQFGFVFTPLKFKLDKLNPISGLKNVFSLKKALEALKLMFKLLIIFAVMVVLFLLTGESFLAMMDKEVEASMDAMHTLLIYFLFTILAIIIIFAIIDFYFTRYYYFKSLRMSKQDIKDEFKNMEGDPRVKARIRSIQMQMFRKRMMANVPDADVVITNPTHYAVALKYDQTKNSAPVVVAKGADFIALKIKDIARENNIPIIENPSLARALHAQIEVEQQIPEEFYKAIAEIFSYVYELKGRR